MKKPTEDALISIAFFRSRTYVAIRPYRYMNILDDSSLFVLMFVSLSNLIIVCNCVGKLSVGIIISLEEGRWWGEMRVGRM